MQAQREDIYVTKKDLDEEGYLKGDWREVGERPLSLKTARKHRKRWERQGYEVKFRKFLERE